jgi:hypothetical protein
METSEEAGEIVVARDLVRPAMTRVDDSARLPGAAGASDTRPGPADGEPGIQRPTFPRLIWYCYGGTVPPENRSWVLHDVTCRTWILRHFARWTMVIGPLFLLYLALMPRPFEFRLYTGLTYALAIYLATLVFMLIDTDRRAVRAGYPHSRPQAVRTAHSIARQRESSFQRRERIAQRQARRGR